MNHFDELVRILAENPETEFSVEAQTLADMGVNFKHLEETAGRKVARRQIIKRDHEGKPVSVIEFTFLPLSGGE